MPKKDRPEQELTKVEKEGIREVEKSFGGAIKFQVGKKVNKVTSKQRDKATSQLVYKRATYKLSNFGGCMSVF